VTAVTWVQFSGAGQITAGAGLTKTGNTLNVGTASASRIVVNADDIDLATTGVAANTYKSVTVDAYGRVTGGTNPTTLAGYGIVDAYTITQIDNLFGSTTSAAASAAAAASSASAASTSASNASTSASNALSSANAAAASFDSFDDRYLGAKASDPTVDNDGNPLITGALYFNTTSSEMRVYSGSAWLAAYLPPSTFVQGPASATDNAIARYDGATGKLIQDSTVYITDGGNLGVGTTSPSQKLAVRGSTQIKETAVRWERATDGLVAGGLGYFYDSENSVAVGAITNHPLKLVTNDTTQVTVDTSGNVGIGTNSPTFGSGSGVEIQRAGIATLRLENSTASNSFELYADTAGNGINLRGRDSSPMNFWTGNTSRMTIDASGNVSVGATAAAGSVSSLRNFGNASSNFAARPLGTAQGQIAGYTFYSTFQGTGDNGPRRSADIWSGFNGGAWGTEFLAFGVAGATDSANQTTERLRIAGDGKITDQYGNIRAIPRTGSAKTGSYTLATTDVGLFVEVGTGGSVTVPNSTFSAGDVVSIFNNTSGNVTLTMSITTAYIGGTDADKNTITLATRGVATILFISGTVCVVTGNVS
jgi:hypothetical protein